MSDEMALLVACIDVIGQHEGESKDDARARILALWDEKAAMLPTMKVADFCEEVLRHD